MRQSDASHDRRPCETRGMASFKDLPSINVRTNDGWAAYQRDHLSAEDREKYDALVDNVNVLIDRMAIPSNSVRAGRMLQRVDTTTWYLVREP